MHKKDFTKFYATEKNLTAQVAKREVDEFFAILTKAIVLNEEVNITGFGKFYKLHTKAKEGIHPKTRAKITIQAYTSAKFSSGKELKEAIKVAK
jgi:nucleoid DNA-binding protein